MISLPLLKKELKANFRIFLLFLMIITLYSVVIVMMFDPKLGESLTLMAQSMPTVFDAFHMSNPGSTLLEFVTNYLYGFILIVIPLIFMIIVTHHLIIRYIDQGSMAYLLSTPNPRRKIMLTQAFLLLFAICAMVIYTTTLILMTSNLLFSQGMSVSKFILLNTGWLGLLVFLGGMCFLFACIFQEAKFAIGASAGCSIISILLQMLSQVSDKLDKLKYATPITLFQPEGLIQKETNAIICTSLLFILGFFMIGVAVRIFCKKDLLL